MAELATGAVNTLLGVIRNEARRLGRVHGDVLFIQEEMESMRSFLAHLARTRREEQDEQVRTWTNQVRILANDCNNCLDVYLYRRNPDFHRPRRGLRRYLWWGWALWWLREMVARNHAAGQLRELKDRARDVGERRLRYGVKVSDAATPGHSSTPWAAGDPWAGLTAAAPSSSHSVTAAAAEEDDDDEDDDKYSEAEGGGELLASSMVAHGGIITRSDKVKDYFKDRLLGWIQSLSKASILVEEEGPRASETPSEPMPIPSIAFVVPAADVGEVPVPEDVIACEALAEAQRRFNRSVLVDIPDVHPEDYYRVPLRPKDILFYILQALKDQVQGQPQKSSWLQKWKVYFKRKEVLREIKDDIDQKVGVGEKLEGIIERIGNQLPQDKEIMKDKKKLQDGIISMNLKLDDLLCLLIILTEAVDVAEQEDQAWKKVVIRTLPRYYDNFIQHAATKLEGLVKEGTDSQVPLHYEEYKRILEEVFPRTPTGPGTSSSTSTSVEAEIKEMICKVKDMIQELQEYSKSAHTNQEMADQIQETTFQQTARKKIDEIKLKIREQLKIKKIMDRIQSQLKADDRIMIILKTHHKYGWEAIRNTLSLLGSSRCFVGAAILMTTTTKKGTRQAQEYNLHFPQLDIIELSLVGCYLDDVRQHTSKHMHRGHFEIVRNILEKCGPNEFCMNIFVEAMKANPRRNIEELRRLHNILQATPPERLPSSIARKMLKFSYNDLPKQHKSCLLYLAIFDPADSRYKIRRSTLVGRWVAEGLITTEDWSWFSSVTEADKCFDVLAKKQFVRPVDIGATGRIKSCTVYPVVHRFITKIAKKQHIVEARLSLNLARHFSIFNDVRLRGSDTIETFLKKNMHDLPQFSKLKVLDLEGCHYFANKEYLRDICSKILMLKYLSLRNTNAKQLPREINNLHELEVLDIRQTEIRASATRHVVLLKLKRLLAGDITDPFPCSTDTGTAKHFCSVDIPSFIEKMVDVEVLSNVKPRRHRDLRDIGSLCQLRKLGVVINKDRHLQSLLNTISDLSNCLQSLSITLNIPRYSTDLKDLKSPPNSLESLTIKGRTQKEKLLQFLVPVPKDSNLAKVTLSGELNKDDLKVVAKLSNLGCVRLRHATYNDSELTFDNDEFPKLKVLIVENSGITKISFAHEFPMLEKIVWSFNQDFCPYDKEYSPLSGIEKLRRLKELVLIGDIISPEVDEAFKKYSNENKFVYKKLENQDLALGNDARKGRHGVARYPSIWQVVKGQHGKN
ncbi:disease resistance protein RPP13-like [Panicum miliaceum]|uniref:Disease resistance protein RPP13-like n=1 Tax=Panicum miliaceum TaxID=4540 RepID=A0A3L6Q393_PANMI|nr:disease resistance protein RPP13-like [Panicum miliaceum]